ncbi:MAG: glycosyltransferase family 2 protein [Bacteroidales bacterium]
MTTMNPNDKQSFPVKGNPTVGIVVPCYNEEEVIEDSNTKLLTLLEELKKEKLADSKSFIGYIDDGSKDTTWKILRDLSKKNPSIKAIKLSRNYGHQFALLSGLASYNGFADCLISIDADLQDDIKVIKDMIREFQEGVDIVYGVRKSRKKDTFFKRFTAVSFYKLMRFFGVDVVFNHADFRLSSKRVNTYLNDFEEVNLFLRGIFPLIGFKSSNVYYDRMERLAGETKYPLKKMLAFALEGISSFSVKPLRMVTFIGFIIFIVSIGMAFYSLYSYFYLGTVPGWTSITLPIYFISGIQLLSIGVIGEYLGKVYREVKARPRYIIEEEIL